MFYHCLHINSLVNVTTGEEDAYVYYDKEVRAFVAPSLLSA
ncbi:hypothetical protein [Candidatus Acidianus copahuensis]|nr:hypothetical protein [Candidatus Acidianus copahuensis]